MLTSLDPRLRRVAAVVSTMSSPPSMDGFACSKTTDTGPRVDVGFPNSSSSEESNRPRHTLSPDLVASTRSLMQKEYCRTYCRTILQYVSDES
ncbi:hypothetical protein GCM10009845_21030 [Pedococcus bigeumensis]